MDWDRMFKNNKTDKMNLTTGKNGSKLVGVQNLTAFG